MKIILSRKGFDSSSGGMPSPIMPDGRFLSLPIPSKNDRIRYADLSYDNDSYLKIIKDLHPNFQEEHCHLDPDLIESVTPRQNKWEAAFGQEGAAAGHLDKQGVDVGDIFLFFGRFRKAAENNGKYTFIKKESEIHAIFGYLQVKRVLRDIDDMRRLLPDHPHSLFYSYNNNRIYLAADRLLTTDHPGAGLFRFNKELVLTSDDMPASRWKKNFFPKMGYSISYHSDSSYKDGYFQSAGRGQEFVIDADSELIKWVEKLSDNYLYR